MDAERQVREFVAKYSPEVGEQIQAARAHLATLFPRGYELVYDNYNALVLGISPSQRASDVVVSIAAYPRWVTLFFLKGANLPDPAHVLQGKGSTVRSVRLQPFSVLHSPPVLALLEHVRQLYASRFGAAPSLCTVVKSVSRKQRPRTPAG
jgi:hypothetical protein